MAVRLTLDEDRRVTIPDELLRELNVETGEHLLAEVRDGVMTIVREPESYGRRLKGLHKEIWEGIDAQEYVRKERESWRT